MNGAEIPWKELTERYAGAFGGSIAWLAIGIVCAEVAVLTSSGGPERPLRSWLRRSLLLVTVACGLAWAWHLRWIADDAFISFRYSKNFANGLGLVFNPGERVEGYTNFLWTFLLGVLASIGLNPVSTAVLLAMACFAGMIVLSAYLPALAFEPGASGPPPLLSPAAVLVGANYTLASFATSGLETLFAASLSLVALWLCIRQRPLAAGVCGVCAAMAHPDHGLLYASLALALVLDRERRRGVLRFALPFVVLYLPYFLWRWQYYGDLFPNTYYAKSADRPYFSQGGVYLVASAVGSGVWAALPLFIYGAYRLRSSLIARYALISTPLFAYYVARVGGDFMLGRLLVPLLPVCLVLAEAGARSLVLQAAGARRPLATIGLYVVALAAVPVQIIKPVEKIWHVADERTFYLLDTLQPLAMQSWYLKEGRDLKRYFTDNGLKPRLMIGAIGIVSYFSELPVVDRRGLTERTIAREPISERGRPGHERDASGSYALAAGAQLSEAEVYPNPYSPLTKLQLTNSPYYFTRYDRQLSHKLSTIREAQFVKFEEHLDAYHPPTADPETFWCDAWFFETYYFSNIADPERLETLRRTALAAYPELSRVRAFIYAPPAAGSGWRRVKNFDFQAKTGGWYAHGEAFSNWPATTHAPPQQYIVGSAGSFLNSFVPRLGDSATGMLVSSPFAIGGDVIAFSIAGGRDPEHLRVSLVVDGQRRFSATGCTSEVLGRRAWDVSALRGRRAVLEIADDSGGGWGHIVVDEIGQYVADR